MGSSSVMTLLIKKLHAITDLLSDEIGTRIIDAGNKIKKLERALNTLESILEDADLKQLGDDEVYDFLVRLKDLVYDAEDMLDEWILYIQRKKMSHDPTGNKVSSSRPQTDFGYVLNCCLRFRKIKRLTKKFQKMKQESLKYNLSKTVRVVPIDISRNSGFDNFCYCDDQVVYGREFDKEIIFKKIFEGSTIDNREVPGVRVISIVGIGGIGKTTLAKYVYNDDKVKSNFDTRLWVSIPQTASSYLEITVRRILEALSSSSGDDFSCGQDIDLMSLLCYRIKQKKFLLVLDDVWDENIQKWQSLKKSLNSGLPGSSILILTRNKMVACLMSTTTLHELQPLSKESAWDLFRRNALGEKDNGGGDALKPFQEIGRIVSQRCNGVPLALKCLGALLRTKQTRQEWEDVMESDKWELLEMEPILPALYFSYYSLPPVLKLCFSYTATFTKAYEIDKGMLIKLWMAQGFLGSSTTHDRDPELIGEECFQELVMRSFFNPQQMNKDGVTCIKMHDLFRDLAASMSGSSVMEIGNTASKTKKARHLSVLQSDLDSFAGSIRKGNHVSSFKLIDCRVSSKKVFPYLIAHLKFLRVLDMSYLCITELPSQMRKLKHLRYLNLSHTNLECLPEILCDLHNLQILILNHCEKLLRLPESLAKLSGLRHLENQNTPKLEYFPEGFGKLTNLRTLSKFVIASSSEKGAKIGELKELNLLEGHLEIRGLKRVKSGSDAMKAELVKKKHLRYLCLDFECDTVQTPKAIKIMENVLEALEPFPEIRSNVEVLNYPSSKYPSWISPSDSDQTPKNMDCIESVGVSMC